MTDSTRLVYGYDAICGWCFGFVPAMRKFAETHPDVAIDVVPGGLFSGDRACHYTQLVDHIVHAFPRITSITGQKPCDGFWDLIKQPGGAVANSTVPNMAVAMMAEKAPERSLEYAHRLQEIHFLEAADFNVAETYETLQNRHGFPELDLSAIIGATDDSPEVAKAYARSRRLQISSYPTVLLVDDKDTVLSVLPSTYDPAGFEQAYFAALSVPAHEPNPI